LLGGVFRIDETTLVYGNVSQKYIKEYVDFVKQKQMCEISEDIAKAYITLSLKSELSKNNRVSVTYRLGNDSTLSGIAVKPRRSEIFGRGQILANFSKSMTNFTPEIKNFCEPNENISRVKPDNFIFLDKLLFVIDKALSKGGELTREAIINEYFSIVKTDAKISNAFLDEQRFPNKGRFLDEGRAEKFSPSTNVLLFDSESHELDLTVSFFVKLSLLLVLWSIMGLTVGILVSALIPKRLR
jgi:hypothetical protein